jgi:hypothetical protein
MRLAKGVRLQLRLRTDRQGALVLESTQAPANPAQVRAWWQEVADFAQRQALEDAAADPLPPLPVVLTVDV